MKKIAQIFLPILAIVMILSMLRLGPGAQAERPSAILELPTTTPSAAEASPTATSPILTATATPNPIIFRDDFNGTLAPGWTWVNEDPITWNLTAFPGFLQVALSGGSVHNGNYTNMLLRPLPEGDVQVTTGFTFRAFNNFQFVGLIFYESDANYFQIGRSYCRGSSAPCIRSGIYMQLYENFTLGSPNEAISYNALAPFVMRMTRRGNEYSIDVSGDGQVWYRFAEYTLAIQPTHVGLIAAQNLGDPATAIFDFFEISEISE